MLEKIGKPLGLDANEAAAAIVRIANDKMAGAIRMVSLARGHDPRDFVLFPFGGAGPLHAAAMAKELGIPRLLVPARPGITNALGCVVADLRHDFVNTINKPVQDVDIDSVTSIIEGQIKAGKGAPGARRHRDRRRADPQHCRHAVPGPDPHAERGPPRPQGHPRTAAVAVREGLLDPLRGRTVRNPRHAGQRAHRRDWPCALASTLRLLSDRAAPHAARKLLRAVWFTGGFRDTPVYPARVAAAEARRTAIIEQLDCTTVVEPGNKLTIDKLGNLLIEV